LLGEGPFLNSVELTLNRQDIYFGILFSIRRLNKNQFSIAFPMGYWTKATKTVRTFSCMPYISINHILYPLPSKWYKSRITSIIRLAFGSSQNKVHLSLYFKADKFRWYYFEKTVFFAKIFELFLVSLVNRYCTYQALRKSVDGRWKRTLVI
jgi:hypothetical protein